MSENDVVQFPYCPIDMRFAKISLEQVHVGLGACQICHCRVEEILDENGIPKVICGGKAVAKEPFLEQFSPELCPHYSREYRAKQ